jgi:hypothetical protein
VSGGYLEVAQKPRKVTLICVTRFLLKGMPEIMDHLHYRIVGESVSYDLDSVVRLRSGASTDVSTIKVRAADAFLLRQRLTS